MRKKKKVEARAGNFMIAVALYSVFAVAAVTLLTFIISTNLQYAGIIKQPQIVETNVAQASPMRSAYVNTMEKVQSYIEKNISTLAAANNAGDGDSVVDSVDFINTGRALVFYHENQDQYLAEVVFSANDGQAKIDRFMLKMKNDKDYSNGVYGAD